MAKSGKGDSKGRGENSGQGATSKGAKPAKPVYDRLATMELVCALIARGKSLVTITSSNIPGIPTYECVLKWLREDDKTEDKVLVGMYARAREDQADFIADEILAIADDASEDEIFVGGDDSTGASAKRVMNSEFVQRSKLRIDARKWVAAKLKPRKYGEKLEVAGDADAPLTLAITLSREDAAL